MKALLKFGKQTEEKLLHTGLLFSRIGFGIFMAVGHGLPKLQNYAAYKSKFPDPLGMGNELSMAMAIVNELVLSIFLIFGLGTRYALGGLIITMGVAAFIVHGADPLFAAPGQPSKEFALVYFLAYVTMFLAGPGKYSLDAVLEKKFSKQEVSQEAVTA